MPGIPALTRPRLPRQPLEVTEVMPPRRPAPPWAAEAATAPRPPALAADTADLHPEGAGVTVTRAGTEEAAAVEDTAGAGAEEEMGATVAEAAEEVATVAEAVVEGATVAVAAVMEEGVAAEDTAGTRSSQTTRSSCRDCPQTPPRKTSHSSSVPSE